jgi:threonylcarbamoyladenosine tRNA methylthiotransferase MtaB
MGRVQKFGAFLPASRNHTLPGSRPSPYNPGTMHLPSSTRKPRAALHTLGCRLNQAETAVLADRLRGDGYDLVESGTATDLLIVNTCSVTEGAEADCRNLIRRTLRKSPQAFVAVTGCYAQTGAEALRRIDGVDLIVGTQYKLRLPDLLPPPQALRKAQAPQLLHTRRIEREEFSLPGTGTYSTTRAMLKIQDGCDFMCSFCIIPFARGRERSRRFDDVIREAEELALRGHREVVLTGVNIGHYSCQNRSLLDLIQRLELVDGIDRIRLSSIEPTTISGELLDHMAVSSKLCPYLHVPLQSGDNAILEAMNRRYSAREYRLLIEKAIARVPHLGLGTDLLVGFPGEDEHHFANTMALAADLPFDYFHVFTFSKRPGTPAMQLKQSTPSRTIKIRRDLLADLSRTKRIASYQRYVGQTVSVLFESEDSGGLWTGLTGNFVRVGTRSPGCLKNEVRRVLITGVMDGLAVGDLACHADESQRPRGSLNHVRLVT